MTDAIEIKNYEPEDVRPPEYSDEALTLAFTKRHGANLRYVAPWNAWFIWDGNRWRRDDTLKVLELARILCRQTSAEASPPKVAAAIASAKTVRAVEQLARADRKHAAAVTQWDADPWLLGTPDGVVDLRTGRRRRANREDYISRITAVAPSRDAGGANATDDCPLFLEFLKQVTNGDAQLQLFLQRIAGYALTGNTEEHALFFLFGKGANGKSVFISTISHILGEYAITAPMEAFVASPGDRHPTELAGLLGARLVTAIETEAGRRWNESRICALTGGDKIAARFMRGDFFEYVPQFKILIAGNHRPALRGVGEAIRRRMNVVPFELTIPPEQRDEKLLEKLRAEAAGILTWMIEGCLDWQGEGLAQPEAVREATGAYIEAEDVVGQWLAECCNIRIGFQDTVANLFVSWRRWAERGGEYVGSRKHFSQTLLDRGFVSRRTHGGTRGFEGLAVKIEEPVTDGDDAVD